MQPLADSAQIRLVIDLPNVSLYLPIFSFTAG